jgi:small GTP-binding protein
MIESVYKIVILGNEYSGKTSILSKYTKNIFNQKYDQTIGIGYDSKTIKSSENKNVKLQIWDTSGNKRFSSLTQAYYYVVSGFIFVFDVTDFNSFTNIGTTINDLKYKNVPMILIGNKIDLEKDRVVTESDVHLFIENSDIDIFYIETSAKTGQGIDNAFDLLIEKIISTIPLIPVVDNSFADVNYKSCSMS